jgi:hypothetical protein
VARAFVYSCVELVVALALEFSNSCGAGSLLGVDRFLLEGLLVGFSLFYKGQRRSSSQCSILPCCLAMEEVRLVVRQSRQRVAADQRLVEVLLGWDSRWGFPD